MTHDALTEFLGWMSVINIGFLMVTTVFLILMPEFPARVHSRMFDVDEQDVKKAYFQYLAQFKLAVLVFNIAPYLALKIMG